MNSSAMMRHPHSRDERYLGVQTEATRTVALLADGSGRTLRRLETGPAHLKLLTEAQLARWFRSIAAGLPRPDALGIGLAGAWLETDSHKIRSVAARVWPRIPCSVTNDLETTLMAGADGTSAPRMPRVLVVSDCDSGSYGRGWNGTAVRMGGWGHVLGGKGSGYDIGLRALQAVVDAYDHKRAWPPLGRRLLRALQLNEPMDLIDWAPTVGKEEIASLAAEVYAAQGGRDKMAAGILAEAARHLTRDAVACARLLAKPGTRVQFVLAGRILQQQPRLAAQVGRALRKLWPQALVTPLEREGVWGAVELAKRALKPGERGGQGVESAPGCEIANPESGRAIVRSSRQSPTELRNPRSMRLDTLPLSRAITLMLSEERSVPGKLQAERRRIAQLIRAIVRAFRRGGRLFYVGAGTSGRLGVLDASECPPTFGTPPGLVQGIIAGGQPALWRSVEGAEDRTEAGGRAVEFRGVNRRDVVVGIAASGTTPFVWGALGEARRRGATTALICFNPFLQIPRALRPGVVIAPNLGPEVLTGSTRLKAGTATKQLLNILTTLAMVRLGKVRSNLMIDLSPANSKLRGRAVRIVRDLTGADASGAEEALRRSGWVVKKAIAKPGRKPRAAI